MNDASVQKMLAGIDRIEKRQAAYEVVVHRILGCLEIHNEKFERLIAEVRGENGGNAITSAITDIVSNSNRTVAILESIYEEDLIPEWDEDGKNEAAFNELQDKPLSEPARDDAH